MIITLNEYSSDIKTENMICKKAYYFLPQEYVLEKAEEPENKLPTSTGSWKKQESSRKTSDVSKVLPEM